MPVSSSPRGDRRRALAALLAGVLAALAAVAVTALPQRPARADVSAAAVCDVTYRANQWTGGYTAEITVTNLGAALNGWQLRWTYPAGQRVTSAWNAQVTQDGTRVTAVSAAHNASLATGASASFGLQGTWTTANPAPTDFALNGTPCGDQPTPDPTTPDPDPTTPDPDPTTPAPDPGCGTATVCSGFEDQTGTTPSGAWQVGAPNCQGTGTAAIDTSVAHSGGRSLRINGAAGYCNHVFVGTTANVSAIGPVVYGRFYVRHTTALPAAHVTMVTMADANDGGRELRIGGQNGALQWNRERDDATLPEQSPTGVGLSAPLPVGEWVCVRFEVDTTRHAMRTWLGDTEIAGLRVDGTPTQDVDGQWLRGATQPPRPSSLRLGWESYGDGADTLWYDDVALGSAPIGC
ncbi:cellulose-binding domain-containing protein [Allostreptomyces psammosilenae]|uniref:CBM2 domain-containing protein n=1 Tax=Allostreptomyces psammosilenae TaxID=1892865 RepID=A0A853A1F5_9ACTN|nr:cellulose-binding domain-containing protein [Allostreptomyces psammosilenae]NYI04352.1 hypothetical protein [Allostreptomyces psammosilenae]